MSNSSRLVLVTGATRGLGKFVAEKFWQNGDDLILVARNQTGLEEVTDALSSEQGRNQHVYSFVSDLSVPELTPLLIEKIKKEVGNPDILINNAAIQGPIGPVYSNNWNDWQKCLNVCLLAPVQICREFLPFMIEQNYGRIVNISGGGATTPRRNFSSYATAKCGLVRFSETIAQEVSNYNITINCVAPGIMNSELTRDVLQAGENNAGISEIEAAMNIRKRDMGNGLKAASLIHFLTTEECSHINGKIISAVWDRWEELPNISDDVMKGDIYTLRRIIPEDHT